MTAGILETMATTDRRGATSKAPKRAGARGFWRREDGAAAVDFVLIVGPLLATALLVIDLSVSYLLGQTIEKAAAMGARVASVSNPAAMGVPTLNEIANGAEAGALCSDTPSPCAAPEPKIWRCSGGGAGCDAQAFATVMDEIGRLSALVEDRHVTVTYEYTALGRSGGALAPMISVEIAGVESPLGFLTGLRSAFGLDADVSALPTARAVAVAEDLHAGSG